MMFNNENYKDYDQELWEAIQAEEDRQEHNIELIASEKYGLKGCYASTRLCLDQQIR